VSYLNLLGNGKNGLKLIAGYEKIPMIYFLKTLLPSAPLEILPCPPFPSTSSLTPQSSEYPTVVLGGTFDHLHAAHKLLLQLSHFVCSRRIIVGVMSDSLLHSKSNASLVEPLPIRIKGVEGFLSRCGEGILIEVVEIHDPFGPSISDPDIQAIVVSKETKSGGEAVNRERKKGNLGVLQMFVIDVIASEQEEIVGQEEKDLRERAAGEGGEMKRSRDLSQVEDEGKLKELKMGSTAIRQWIKDGEGKGDSG
jgi:pantetheine-phosphate adenylyltransferase